MSKIYACSTKEECQAHLEGMKNLPHEDDGRHYNGCAPVENNCAVCAYVNADGTCGY